MNTPEFRRSVSVVTVTLAVGALLALGGCRRSAAPVTWNGPSATADGRVTIDFANEAPTYVDVYLVGELREWRLGRVAPGAHTRLRLPLTDDELSQMSGFVRLAVLASSVQSQQAARDPRATTTIAQPVGLLLEHQWVFRQTPLAAPEIFSKR